MKTWTLALDFADCIGNTERVPSLGSVADDIYANSYWEFLNRPGNSLQIWNRVRYVMFSIGPDRKTIARNLAVVKP